MAIHDDKELLREYPSNSNKSKSQRLDQDRPKKEPVVKGTVVIQEDGFLKKAYHTIFKATPEEVFKSVWDTVIVPGFIDILNSIWRRSGDVFFYGADGKRGRPCREYDRPSWYTGTSRTAFQERPNPGRTRLDEFRNIRYESKEEAESVVRDLQDDLEHYNAVQVGRVFEASNLASVTEPIHFDWGWENLDGISIEPTYDGMWRIIFPRPIKL